MKETVVIDLMPYCQYRNDLTSLLKGREIAEKTGILSLGDKQIILKVSRGCFVYDSFVRGLLGELVRKVGPTNLDVKFEEHANPVPSNMFSCLSGMNRLVDQFIAAEQKRIAERDRKKALKAVGEQWSEPVAFLIPEIGTVLRLEEDWEFTLHDEHRNDSLMEKLGGPKPQTSMLSRRPGKKLPVTLKAGSVLSVVRVYIRVGNKDFSSLTFYARKGAVFSTDKGDRVLGKAERFWVKLSEVNRMRVVVDQNTLAMN